MRERWRAELDRSDAARFDLKQGRGALVDVEFTLQALVLGHAAAHRGLVEGTRTRALIAAAHAAGLLDGAESAALAAAHDALLAASLDRTLDAAPRTVARNDALAERTAEVERIAARIIGPVDDA